MSSQYQFIERFHPGAGMNAVILPLIIVLVVIGTAIFFALRTVHHRNRELTVRAEVKRKEQLLLEAQQAKRRDDERYNRIINCPGCEGTGVCGMEFDNTDGLSLFWYVGPSRQPTSERQSRCPLCNGSGTAHAFSTDETCPKCMGSGENMARVKAEIGMEDKAVPCAVCAGKGSTAVIHVRFAVTYFPHSFYFAKFLEPCFPEQEELYGHDFRRKFVLTSLNEEFFGKWKPRDLHFNA
jgi:hypothetical protein